MKTLKKTHKIKTNSLTYSCHLLKAGSYGLKVLNNLQLTKEQKNSIERFLLKKLKNLSNYSKKYKL
jgi:hypothetical protein